MTFIHFNIKYCRKQFKNQRSAMKFLKCEALSMVYSWLSRKNFTSIWLAFYFWEISQIEKTFSHRENIYRQCLFQFIQWIFFLIKFDNMLGFNVWFDFHFFIMYIDMFHWIVLSFLMLFIHFFFFLLLLVHFLFIICLCSSELNYKMLQK